MHRTVTTLLKESKTLYKRLPRAPTDKLYLLKKVCHSEVGGPKAGQVAGIIPAGGPLQGPPTNKTGVPPL